MNNECNTCALQSFMQWRDLEVPSGSDSDPSESLMDKYTALAATPLRHRR